jgi:glycosyltransferase involved in cell wall biosynthesis
MLTKLKNRLRWWRHRVREHLAQVARIEQHILHSHRQVEEAQRILEQHIFHSHRQVEAAQRILEQHILYSHSQARELGRLLAHRPNHPLNQIQEAPATLEQHLFYLQNQAEQQRQIIAQLADSLVALAEQSSVPAPTPPAATPLVSVILPTWNRAAVLERAIRSLLAQSYRHWECLLIDDGSIDDTTARLEPYLSDARFRYLQQAHRGVSAARNLGLEQARGEIIAYLDADNEWLPNYLAAVVSGLSDDPTLQAVYAGQIVRQHEPKFAFIRAQAFDYTQLRRDNYIDLNVFAHRADLCKKYGGFDEQLIRLNDWDLILRYTEREPVRRLPLIGGIYYHGLPNQLTLNHSGSYYRYRVMAKRQPVATTPLKVLYAVWHYPQLSESYVHTEIVAVRQLGIEVEVWSEEKVAAPFISEVPVHNGNLRDAIAQVKPDLIHTHWLDMAEKYSDSVRAAGLPLTVRGHGFEFSPGLVNKLDQNPTVQAAYVFPHLAAQCTGVSPKIRPLPTTFNPELYSPNPNKDRQMVLRAGCALPTKDYLTFMQVARLCPNQRFVLVLCHAYLVENYLNEIIALREQLGAPVEILVDLQYEEVARLTKQAGIYLHTIRPDSTYGMPISISEAMATGSYVIGRRCLGALAYIQEAGRCYDTAEEAAALIRQTESWSDEQWRQAYLRSLERAYSSFVSTEVLKQLVADWYTITGKTNCSAESARGSALQLLETLSRRP